MAIIEFLDMMYKFVFLSNGKLFVFLNTAAIIGGEFELVEEVCMARSRIFK